jgi:hypothetical protein
MTHPDLARLRQDSHTIRVESAWSVAMGTPIPPAVQMRLEREAMEFIGSRLTCSPRSRPPKKKRVRLNEKMTRVQKDDRLGCTRYDTGFKTHSFSSPHSIETGGVKFTCSTLSEGRISFRGSVSITHDINGKRIDPIRISGPNLRTHQSKEDIMEEAKTYMNNLLFELYVRTVSYIRRIRFLSGTYPGNVIDTLLSQQSSACVIDYVIPDGLVESPFKWEERVRDIARSVCEASGIEFFDVTLINDDDSMSSMSDE